MSRWLPSRFSSSRALTLLGTEDDEEQKKKEERRNPFKASVTRSFAEKFDIRKYSRVQITERIMNMDKTVLFDFQFRVCLQCECFELSEIKRFSCMRRSARSYITVKLFRVGKLL